MESFFKRLLLNHKIKKLNNNAVTEKGTIQPLADTIKRKIDNLFIFPPYSKNLKTGFFHLIESSKFMVSGFADNGAVHGKSETHIISPIDFYSVVSFIITLIKLLLTYEIKITSQALILSNNERIALKCLRQNKKRLFNRGY